MTFQTNEPRRYGGGNSGEEEEIDFCFVFLRVCLCGSAISRLHFFVAYGIKTIFPFDPSVHDFLVGALECFGERIFLIDNGVERSVE